MVGQSLYSLMPLRISGSCSTSTVSNLTPRWSRMATARLEKPHCGKSALPFMNRTTSSALTISSIRWLASLISSLLFRHRRRQLQRVERAAHPPAERLIDRLVLLDPRQAPEALRNDARRIMVPVAGKIDDLDARVGDPLADQSLDILRRHRHDRISSALR